MIEVVKRPIPVQATFMADSGVLETLEGPVHFQAGDAVLTGIQGERWPVQRARFLVNYQPVSTLVAGQDGAYTKRPSKSMAQRMEQPFSVSVGYAKDKLNGKAGDWLLYYADGSQGIVASDVFDLTYQLLL